MNGLAHDICKGGGGGRLVDGVAANTSGYGGGGRLRGGLVDCAANDACGGE